MAERAQPRLARRAFLRGAATAAAGITFVRAGAVKGSQANSKIELGIIGAGSRGNLIGDIAHEHTQMKVVALADVFDDRLAETREKLHVDAGRCYKGLDAYHKLLGSKLDAVAIESPPYFHPEQAMAAVEAGKHVYLAKPVAVDVPGCHMIEKAGEKAKGHVSFLVDFQTRATPFYMEAAQRVLDGAIGKPVCGQVFYHANRVKLHGDAKDTSPAGRLRNWVFDKALSGDIIVEQNVHVIDVANWYLNAHPIRATGTGGRKARTDVGDCWDHFIVTFEYPDEVLIDFSSSQFLKGFNDLCARIYGTEGTVDTHYNGDVAITGDHPYKGGSTSGMFHQGAVTNVKSFEESIRSKKFLNNADESSKSTLTTILGRTAAYQRASVTWDEMMKDGSKIEANLHL